MKLYLDNFNAYHSLEVNNRVKYFIILILFNLFFLTSTLGVQNWGWMIVFVPLKDFFHVQPGNIFPGFELLMILFLLSLMFNGYTVSLKKNQKFLFYLFLYFSIFAIINPNNSLYESGLSFFINKVSRTLLIGLLIVAVFFRIEENKKKALLSYFLKQGVIIAVLKSGLDLFFLAIGMGPHNAFGVKVSLVGGDIMAWLVIFHIYLIIQFLMTNKKKYLYYSLIIFVNLLMSFQRTAFLNALIFDLFFIFYFFLIKKRIKFSTVITISLAVSFFVIFILQTQMGSHLFKRMAVVFEFTGMVTIEESDVYNDSGHLNQSKTTTMFFMDNIDNFWGGGINRRDENYLTVEGQSGGGVHNNIVSMWQYFGLPGVFFYASLFMFFINNFYKHALRYKLKDTKAMFLGGISLYFIVRFISGWFSGDFFFLYLQKYLQYIFLLMFFTIQTNNFDFTVYENIKRKRIAKCV